MTSRRETMEQLRRALSQAQTFVGDAPLEALARARLVVHDANAALLGAEGEQREELASIAAQGASRVGMYETAVAAWSRTVRNRAELFHTHEVARLQRPIASKI